MTMTEHEILQRLTALCSRSEQCTHDVREKMRRWGVDDDMQQRVVESLHRDRYVDDVRYCRMFVRDKINFSKWGRRKIESALYAKRSDGDTVSSILDEVTDDDYLRVLRPLLAAKRRTIKADNDWERDAKLARFALGRGFTYDLIRPLLKGDVECEDNVDEYPDE